MRSGISAVDMVLPEAFYLSSDSNLQRLLDLARIASPIVKG